MKIVIKPPKPRNPFATAAKQRPGGAHGSHRIEQKLRRNAKQALKKILNRGLKEEEG